MLSRSEQNEHARLCSFGVPLGAAGGEDRGTHHLLQPQRDEVDEGRRPCRGRTFKSFSSAILSFVVKARVTKWVSSCHYKLNNLQNQLRVENGNLIF